MGFIIGDLFFLSPSSLSLPPSLLLPLFLGLAWFAPPLSLFLLSYCKFLKHQQCLFHRRTFCRGRGRYPVAAPAPSVECGEVPGGRPRVFCGGQGNYPVAAPVPFEGSGEVPSGRPRTFCGGQWREGGMQGGSNGKGNCDSKFVLVATPFTNRKGHIFVPWGL